VTVFPLVHVISSPFSVDSFGLFEVSLGTRKIGVKGKETIEPMTSTLPNSKEGGALSVVNGQLSFVS
jgi:hypothetical protein